MAHDMPRRWRLILGSDAEAEQQISLSDTDLHIDRALEALYNTADRKGGLGPSYPQAARWLGDIRTYFPQNVVHILQRDAYERLGMRRMLLEPETLSHLEPNVHLAAQLLQLKNVIPNKVKDTARWVVRRVVEDLERRLAEPLREAVMGSLNRTTRNTRPRHSEMDWPRTIRANLKHYQPDRKTLIVQKRVGFGRKRSSLMDIILCVDQSGSMATSVVYSSIFGAVLASLKAVSTRLVAFDTEVVDLSDHLIDPVDVLFGLQLGGGTDIDRALAYCSTHITRPENTVLFLISDLFEGGDRESLIRRAEGLVRSGVHIIALLALSDDGKPSYDHRVAQAFSNLGICSFACTPDLFPSLMARAIGRKPIDGWAASQGIAVSK